MMKNERFRIYLTMSGNLGDTLNTFPVLDGLSKIVGPIDIILNPKMRMFNGIDELFNAQDCINSVSYIDTYRGSDYHRLGLVDDNTSFQNIPGETARCLNYARSVNGWNIPANENFVLKIPYVYTPTDSILVGDRTLHEQSDHRRKSNVLRDSGKFDGDKYEFLDYSKTLIHNANLLISSDEEFITTFTGIAVMADLMFVSTTIYYTDELMRWNGKTIEESFKQHFFNRNCKIERL